MYRVYDKQEAIRRVQLYLAAVDDGRLYVAPTGIFDESTALSVTAFQNMRGLEPTGVVNRETFDLLYLEYVDAGNKDRLYATLGSFISFPLLPGQGSDSMMNINRMLATLMNYYGFSHNLRDSNFYSDQTSDAVRTMRKIYLLPDINLIDEDFYIAMLRDHNYIGRLNGNFS